MPCVLFTIPFDAGGGVGSYYYVSPSVDSVGGFTPTVHGNTINHDCVAYSCNI